MMRFLTLTIVLAGLLSASCSSPQPRDRMFTNPKKFALAKENIRELVPTKLGSLATDLVMVEGRKIGYMYREIPRRPEDSGWRFFSGDEDQAYLDDLGHSGVYAVNTVANYDPDIIPYLNTPAPCAFEKIEGTNKYRRVAR